MSEQGIRVYFEAIHQGGEVFQDYDPVSSHKFEDNTLTIEQGCYTHSLTNIKSFYEYKVTNDKIDGIYVRVFDDADALEYESDILRKDFKS